ncbi:MAG: c-type cytochrome [Acidobacteriaceae bacterium]
MKFFLLGLILGLLAIPVAAYVYFKVGNPPVAVADPAFPMEQQIVKVPLQARIEKEMPSLQPIQPTAENLEAGARIYREQCAACHGLYGRPSDFAAHMYPDAPQLWQAHGKGKVIGVSDDPPGETFWKVDNGIRLTGMPAFNKVLSPTQIWQVTLLLSGADKLPPSVMDTLRNSPNPKHTAAAAAPKTALHRD